MFDDHLSQIVRHTIEKIEKIPKTSILSLLEELADERKKFFLIFDFALRRAIFIIDSSRRLSFFNSFCLKFGLVSESNGSWVLNEHFRNHVDRILAYMMDKRVSFHKEDIEMLSERDVSDKIFVSKSFDVECSSKDFDNFCFVVTDKTEEKLNEIDKMQEDSISSLSNLVSGVAHEIKNPLSAMYLHAKVLRKILEKDSFDKSYVVKEVDIILSEIDRLNSIVNNFIASLKPYKISEKYENVNDIVKEILDFFMPEFREKGIKVEVVLDESIPLILCDRNLMKQALINLVKNSIDAIYGSDGVIEMKTYFVSKFENDFVVIQIRDNGVGIPDDVKPRIFEPFFTTKENGTGIGLSIVYKIVKLHKGIIDFFSDKEGTVFKILLPVRLPMRELKYDGK
ncbi:MAG: two-component system sensor histidine kinase NtrB [Brevinematia bacterium]